MNTIAGRNPSHTLSSKLHIYDAESGHFKRALIDLKAGLTSFSLIWSLAMRDIRGRYHGAVLGIYWVVITTLATAIGLGVVYSIIFDIDFKSYLPFIATSLSFWGVMTAIVVEGSSAFVSGSSYFLQTRIPIAIVVPRLLLRTFIQTLYRFIALIMIYVLVQLEVTLKLVLIIPGVLLFFYCAFWLVIIVGCINARYRDFGQFSVAFMTLAFFVTPVFWRVDRMGEYGKYLYYNPFFNLLEIVRGPILNSDKLGVHFLHSGVIAILLTIIGLKVYSVCHDRLPYWCS